MNTTKEDNPRHMHPEDEESLSDLSPTAREQIQLLRKIPISVLGTLVNPEHYTGPEQFEEIIDLGNGLEQFRGTEVPEEDRWVSTSQLPRGVTVLAFEDDKILDHLHAVTEIANSTPWPPQEHPDEQAEYAQHIRAVIAKETEHFIANRTAQTAVLIMRRGAEFLIPYFPVNFYQYVSVEAKRLDMYDHTDTGEQGPRTMKFGLTKWDGLDGLPEFESVDLVVPDDCISTAGSLRAGITGLLKKASEGKSPSIQSITVYAAVGVQTGIEALQAFGEEIGIPIHVVVGAVTYAYTDEFYLRRIRGEQGLNGNIYTGKEQVVSDMGAWLSS